MSEEPDGGLRRTLRLRDLVLAQILLIVGLPWLGTAALLGTQQWIYWIVAIVVFQLPLAVVVIYLSRIMPREGGLYQWTRRAYGDFAGFLVAWNFWAFTTIFISLLGLTITTAIGYASGAGETWMSSRAVQIAASAVVTGLLVLLALAGYGAAQWIHNLASLTLVVTACLLIALSIGRGGPRAAPSSAGELSLMQLVLFTRVAVYALAGFECMSVVIGECREGAKAIVRSILIAVPFIGAIYILGTRAVLTFVAPENVDLVNPVAQTFSVALAPLGALAVAAAAGAIVLLALRDVAQSSQIFSSTARLPMVAGWDRMLPGWFTRLSRVRTPSNAILFTGAVTLVSACAAIAVAGRQEAFQILLGTAGVFFSTTYVVMFSIPLFASQRLPVPAPWWLRLAAFSGGFVTLLFLVLTFIPIVEVPSSMRYALIIAAVVVLSNAAGMTIYLRAGHRSRIAWAGVPPLTES